MTKQFQIVINNKGEITRCPQYGTFEDGKTAASYARILTVIHGQKYQVRPVELEEDWREWAAKIAAECAPLNWNLPAIPDHFAHRDPEYKDYIRFIETEADGKIGRWMRWRPETYLGQFYREMSHYERSKVIHQFHNPNGPAEVKFAWTAAEMKRVYYNGPESCMSKPASAYASGDHPVTVYAAGDLAIAYIEDEDGEITHRALVWPAKKIYGRIYGWPEEDLAIALDALGYRWSNMGFNGARLLRIEEEGYYEDEDGDEHFLEGFRLPYLDVVYRVRDNGDYLIMDSDGNIDGQSTIGLTDGRYHHYYHIDCSCCGKKTYDYKIDRDDKRICVECSIKKGIICAVSGQYYPKVELADGRKVGLNYKLSHTFVDPQSGLRYLITECEATTLNERIAA